MGLGSGMINCKAFCESLARIGINFFTGVPDSLLKDFCAFVADNSAEKCNIIAANEGNAIALAAGHYLATGKIGLVYMQNSGLGNAVNPLTSLTDKEIYSIPLLLLIGLRGEPNTRDEPQHAKMGKVTAKLLDVLGIPHQMLDEDFENSIKKAADYMVQKKSPYALIVKKGVFENYLPKKEAQNGYELSREEAIGIILSVIDKDSVVVSTTGKVSRELFELREANKQGHDKDFLTVGSMGHASSIAFGIAMEKQDRLVYCLDGDGAFIMHMGALSTIGQFKPRNFRHLVFNNLSHDSVGGQPTAAYHISIPEIAKANGYLAAFSAKTGKELASRLNEIKGMDGPVLLEIKISKGSRKNLGRPTKSPTENKEDFMKFLRS